jgi:hypothetical protein
MWQIPNNYLDIGRTVVYSNSQSDGPRSYRVQMAKSPGFPWNSLANGMTSSEFGLLIEHFDLAFSRATLEGGLEGGPIPTERRSSP